MFTVWGDLKRLFDCWCLLLWIVHDISETEQAAWAKSHNQLWRDNVPWLTNFQRNAPRHNIRKSNSYTHPSPPANSNKRYTHTAIFLTKFPSVYNFGANILSFFLIYKIIYINNWKLILLTTTLILLLLLVCCFLDLLRNDDDDDDDYYYYYY